MLERKWPLTSESQIFRAGELDQEHISLADIAGFVRRYLFLILAATAAGLMVAALYVANTEPVYRARTQILIEPKLPRFLNEPPVAEVNLSLDTAQVASQMAVLQSEKIARMVISELKLEDDPEFVGAGRKRLGISSLGTWFVDTTGLAHMGWFKSLGGFISRQLADTGWTSKPKETTESERDRRVMEHFANGLMIERMGVSYGIEISFTSVDPNRAAAIANATADAFVREQVENKSASTGEGLKWLESRIDELRQQMNTATQAVQEFRARHDYSIATADAAGTGNDAASADDANKPTLEELQVTADTYRKMYESFLQAYTTSVNQQPYIAADARVITPAAPPLTPTRPRRRLVMIFGTVAGLMMGLGLAFLRHTLDHSVRSPRQVREDFGLDCIGELPPVFGKWGGFGRFDEVDRSRYGLFSRGLQSVQATIAGFDLERPVRTIGITSSAPGEGKSTVASNLAVLWARTGRRVLLVDADIFDAVLTERMLERKVSTQVDETKSAAEQIKMRIAGVPSGKFEALPAPAVEAYDLLIPTNMQSALEDLQAYDLVIVDLPPFTSGPHGLMIGSILDGVVVAVEWGKTPSDLVTEFARALHTAKVNVFGVVMTKVQVPSLERFRKRAKRTPR